MADKVLINRAMAREKLGYCRKGLRHYCDLHGFDWPTFCSQGISLEAIRNTGDARALALIEALGQ